MPEEAEIINVWRINQGICEVLGLDPKRVLSIKMAFTNQGPKVEVEMLADRVFNNGLATILKHYKLVEERGEVIEGVSPGFRE